MSILDYEVTDIEVAMPGFAHTEWMKVVNKKTWKCITLQKQL